jgi:hypothetical protein
MLAQILARGRFLSKIRAYGVNTKKWGLRNPSNALYSFAGMSAKRSMQKKSFSGLKSSERAFCFQRQGFIDEAEQWSDGNCSQPDCAKYSAKVFKEMNGRNSPWGTREVTRVVDRETRELWKGKESSRLGSSQGENAKVRHSNSRDRELRKALVLEPWPTVTCGGC